MLFEQQESNCIKHEHPQAENIKDRENLIYEATSIWKATTRLKLEFDFVLCLLFTSYFMQGQNKVTV